MWGWRLCRAFILLSRSVVFLAYVVKSASVVKGCTFSKVIRAHLNTGISSPLTKLPFLKFNLLKFHKWARFKGQ